MIETVDFGYVLLCHSSQLCCLSSRRLAIFSGGLQKTIKDSVQDLIVKTTFILFVVRAGKFRHGQSSQCIKLQ